MIWLTLVRRHLARRAGRSAGTAFGVASAIFLFVSIESLSRGFDSALSGSDASRTLIVYRENRYCPQTSFLPERYTERIRAVAGVMSVLPIKVYLSNCRASLDVVLFHGAPVDELLRSKPLRVLAGDVERFRREEGAALVGREFAARRGLGVGDQFRFGDVAVDVAGVFASDDPADEGAILTHLEFLQRSGPVDRLGTVTQFEVRIDDPSSARRVALEIDSLFATAEAPTSTRPRAEFLDAATRELREILRFARAFGLVCVLVVIVLVANTVLLAVAERRREFGVYLTVGYGGAHLMRLVLLETLVLTLSGAALGLAGVLIVARWSHLAVGVEGVTIGFEVTILEVGKGVAVATVAAVAAAAAPAMRAAQADVKHLLRSA